MPGSLERIEESSAHLLGIIEEILSLARLEAGTEHFLLEEVEIGDLVRKTSALLKPRAEQKGLTLRMVLPSEPVEVTTDLQKARQILLNLLSNALRFTGRGEVIVQARESGDGKIHLDVQDSGVGVDPAHHEWIFEPFTQVDQSTT